jgi:hypothetical protein
MEFGVMKTTQVIAGAPLSIWLSLVLWNLATSQTDISAGF